MSLIKKDLLILSKFFTKGLEDIGTSPYYSILCIYNAKRNKIWIKSKISRSKVKKPCKDNKDVHLRLATACLVNIRFLYQKEAS